MELDLKNIRDLLFDKSHVEYTNLYQTLVLLACCHTVIYENKSQKEDPSYSAESPDELALIESLRDIGFEFMGRD